MTHVVTDNCIKCKYTDCVEVCPVDCFHEGSNFLAIDPEECIDCTLCVPECPAEAIFPEQDVPAGMEHFLGINAELAKVWPVIAASRTINGSSAPRLPASCSGEFAPTIGAATAGWASNQASAICAGGASCSPATPVSASIIAQPRSLK